MGDKPAMLLDVCSLKLADRMLRFVDGRQRVLPVALGLVRIVRSMPGFLQINERFREFLDFRRKSFHCLLVQAGTSCDSMLKCAVYLMPTRVAFSAGAMGRQNILTHLPSLWRARI